MDPQPSRPAGFDRPAPRQLALSGAWTAIGLGKLGRDPALAGVAAAGTLTVDAGAIEALDTAGAWMLRDLLAKLRANGAGVTLEHLPPRFAELMRVADAYALEHEGKPARASAPPPGVLAATGEAAVAALAQGSALLVFVGEVALALGRSIAQPARIRWRTVAFNIRTAGVDALPIAGLLSFLLGVVVAYQGADQLRQYGANIFVADLVGVSMLREFAPLITAIIVAGRSGSAYAAQIGSMGVGEEIDAMRTIGVLPLEQLVLPKLAALLIALPLLTVFADLLGVAGGMMMARAQLGVGYGEFIDRFARAVSLSTCGVGLAKAPVFAAIIAVIGCFQGFGAKGGADSVGRNTTASVVQSIFLVIVADALFSVAFSVLEL
jgi:phospholipid/cholesterol/gamma-HCH transport system permease protein